MYRSRCIYCLGSYLVGGLIFWRVDWHIFKWVLLFLMKLAIPKKLINNVEREGFVGGLIVEFVLLDYAGNHHRVSDIGVAAFDHYSTIELDQVVVIGDKPEQ